MDSDELDLTLDMKTGDDRIHHEHMYTTLASLNCSSGDFKAIGVGLYLP